MAKILWARLIAFVTYLVVVIAVGLYWGLTAQRECVYQSCNDKGIIIKAGVKEDESPCHNFKTYTCGNMYPSKISVFDQIEHELDEFEDKMMIGDTYNADPFIARLRIMFSNCNNTMDSEVVESKKFKLRDISLKNTYINIDNYIDEDKNPTYSMEEFEFISRYYRFTGQSLFRYYLDQDRKNYSKKALYIGLPISSMLNDEIHLISIAQYTDYIKYVTKRVFKRRNDDLYELVDEMIPHCYNISRIVYGYRQRKVKYLKTNLNKLHQRYSYFDWKRLFLKYFSNDFLTNISIYVEHKSYFTDLGQVISNKKLTNAYMLYTNVMELQLYSTHEFPEGEALQMSLAFTDRKQYCKSLVNRYFGPGIESYVIEKFRIKNPGEEPLNTILEYIKHSLRLYIRKAKWMTNILKKKTTMKINKLRSKLSVSNEDFNELSNEAARVMFYKRACVGDTIVEAVLCLNHFSLNNNMRLVNERMTSFHKDIHSLSHKVTYDHVENTLIIPIGVLQFSAFDRDWPMSLNFGAIGSVISSVLIDGIIKGESCNNDGRCKTGWWLNSTVNNFMPKKKVCYDFMQNHKHDKYADFSSLMDDLLGVKIAFHAYTQFLSKLWKNDATVENLQNVYTNEQLFFMSHASMFCSDEPMKYERNITTKKTVMHYIDQTRFFQTVFGCGYSANAYKQINDCLT